ncbi:MAG TPA: DNA internalization-related competence protein ComEC/Rec2 [Burkholderiales bacterium]|nr:DNA internalization-related competence protein ComEC/Rec2 [Burkholderiales bacterium]
MIVNVAALTAGAWWLQQQPLLPDLTGALVLVPLAALWLLAARRKGAAAGLAARAAALAASAIAGFFWSAAIGHWSLAHALPEQWEGRDIELSGVIAEMTQPAERGVRFAFDVERAHTPGAEVPPRISLTWYQSGDTAQAPDLHPGQRWRLSARLRRPHGNANPDGFDFEAWMLERGIRAVGYVRADAPAALMAARVNRPAYVLERAREAVRARLLRALDGRPYAGVIVALAVGDQRAIPPSQWRVFTRTGVNHLMSISGLHITMVASLAYLLVLRLWRQSETLTLRLPAARAAAAAGLAAALAYAALSGFAVPAQRTVFMLAIVAVALWLGWMTRPLAVLAAAAALVIVLDPMAVISAGFWLSFGAVAVIMLAGGGRIGRSSWLGTWARTQWAVTLALVPLLLAMFQQVSLVSPIANAVAIPLVSLVVVPLTLLAAVLPLDWLAHAAHAVMALCMIVLDTLGRVPDAAWQQHAPPSWAVPLAMIGALWILLPRGFPARWVGAALMLPLFLWLPPRPSPGELWLTVLDVGQGLAVVVRTHGHALLYDTGPAFSDQVSAGERLVVPYLRASGVRGLDGIIVSHDDLDHSGGALAVLQAMPVQWLSSPLSDVHPISEAAAHGRRCSAGEGWEWDGVAFEMLHPDAESYNEFDLKDNDRGCVLRIVSPYGAVLLPADIERRSEIALLRDSPGRLSADVLIAPHHGSRTSSTPEFVRAVAPRLVVFSVGYRNRFGHPHPAVVRRYREQGSDMARTDLAGAVLVKMGSSGIETSGWRQLERRYWQGR